MISLKILKRILVLKTKYWLNIGSKPDFIILGAQKSGTTALFSYIEKYALNFKPPINKELYFFTEQYDKGLKYYKTLFPNKTKDILTGEATPDYLFYHLVPKRVYEMLGINIKFVVILRNPTDRSFSQYNHQNFTNKTKAYDPISFSNAIRKEEERFQINERSSYFYEYKYYSYKSRGIYVKQIENWLKYFPEENFHFITLEDLKIDSSVEMNTLFNFLGLKKKIIFTNDLFNKVNISPKALISDEDRKYLDDFFKPYNDDLERKFGISFDMKDNLYHKN